VGEDKDGKKRNIGGGKANTKGTPQGGVISPLLANLYLHLLDRIWSRRHLQKRFEARLVRYADDFVVVCRKGTEPPMEVVRRVLDRLGLTLNEKKTRIVKAKEEGFTFLGFELRMNRNRRTGNYYPHVQPSKKSLQKIKDRITALTERKRTKIPLPVVIESVNEALIGWSGYFHYKNCSRTLLQLKGHVEQRVRTHLGKRHKVRSRGTGYLRFPNQILYEKYGLYKVPTTAGWNEAHAS
jgi:RNA-directed DNA polymerase